MGPSPARPGLQGNDPEKPFGRRKSEEAYFLLPGLANRLRLAMAGLRSDRAAASLIARKGRQRLSAQSGGEHGDTEAPLPHFSAVNGRPRPSEEGAGPGDAPLRWLLATSDSALIHTPRPSSLMAGARRMAPRPRMPAPIYCVRGGPIAPRSTRAARTCRRPRARAAPAARARSVPAASPRTRRPLR